jgi:hypothetical protein
MHSLRSLAAVLACLLLAAPLAALQSRQATLTEDEVDQIKNAGTEPAHRISLYVKFLNQRADDLKALTMRAETPARDHRIDSALQDFADLMDELGDNLDQYGGRDADLRPALPRLNQATARWMSLLHSLPAKPAYDISRQAAIESLQDLTDQGKQLQQQQTAYFKAHPKEKGQQRAEPQ